MKTVKQIGIYMDHSTAIYLVFTEGNIVRLNESSEPENGNKEGIQSKSSSENLLHNKEKQELSQHYKKISDTIRNFHEVLLFGPTDAKNELFNLLKTNHLFSEIKIEVKATDRMDVSQMEGFVKEFFDK